LLPALFSPAGSVRPEKSGRLVDLPVFFRLAFAGRIHLEADEIIKICQLFPNLSAFASSISAGSFRFTGIFSA